MEPNMKKFFEDLFWVSIPYGKWNRDKFIYCLSSLRFNTLWEMEPLRVACYDVIGVFQYPMGNGTGEQNENEKNNFHLFQYPMGNGTLLKTRKPLGSTRFNTLWEMEPTTICCWDYYSTHWIVRQGFFKKGLYSHYRNGFRQASFSLPATR